MLILLHTSKTMRSPGSSQQRPPLLLGKASELTAYVQTLSIDQIQSSMKVSRELATKTKALAAAWPDTPQSAAIDSFVGDIYSGLQAGNFSESDRAYADQYLRILSGLYGILRPLDTISPYRLEMGYRFPDSHYRNLYDFWGRDIADTLPNSGPIINLAAIEYSKTVTPFVQTDRIITPKFLTIDPKSGEPGFVVVHAKIARGAYARWLITERIRDTDDFTAFNDIGYSYDSTMSTSDTPVFVAEEFGGKGLSIRLA